MDQEAEMIREQMQETRENLTEKLEALEHQVTDTVQTAATFPDGKDRDGLAGLRAYLREKRQGDFVENLCRKLFSYALGRSLILTDKIELDEMRAKLAADGYRFDGLVESIVMSPQFRNKRGGDVARGR